MYTALRIASLALALFISSLASAASSQAVAVDQFTVSFSEQRFLNIAEASAFCAAEDLGRLSNEEDTALLLSAIIRGMSAELIKALSFDYTAQGGPSGMIHWIANAKNGDHTQLLDGAGTAFDNAFIEEVNEGLAGAGFPLLMLPAICIR